MGFNANCGKMQCRAGDARAAGWEGHYSFFCSSTADLLPVHSGCNARLSKSAGRKPASIGRLRVGRPETLVNRAFTGRQAGNARKHWAGGQPLRKCPFYAGFRAGRQRQYRAGSRLPAAAERNDLPAYTPRLLGVPAEPLL